MTTPKVETVTIAGDRYYKDPKTGEKAPGVSAIKGMLNKPALVGAAAKESAIYAVDNMEALSLLAQSDRQAAIDSIKNARFRVWGNKADSGTGVHAVVEQLLKRVLDPSVPGPKVTPTQRQYLSGYAKWYKTFHIKPLWVEVTVWSATHDYAGTIDLIAEVTVSPEQAEELGLPETFTAVIDTKTGASGIWPETALQQVAYKKADFIMLEDGTRVPMPEVDATFALWLRPEGYAFIPLDSSDATWKAFLACRELYGWNKRARSMVGKPINPNPIKRAPKKP